SIRSSPKCDLLSLKQAAAHLPLHGGPLRPAFPTPPRWLGSGRPHVLPLRAIPLLHRLHRSPCQKARHPARAASQRPASEAAPLRKGENGPQEEASIAVFAPRSISSGCHPLPDRPNLAPPASRL